LDGWIVVVFLLVDIMPVTGCPTLTPVSTQEGGEVLLIKKLHGHMN